MYLYPPEAGWPSYTSRNREPILVALTTRMGYGGIILSPRSPYGKHNIVRITKMKKGEMGWACSAHGTQ
jgi:hypothetical protein